jgi:uncharacterized delta-60 repeat protein
MLQKQIAALGAAARNLANGRTNGALRWLLSENGLVRLVCGAFFGLILTINAQAATVRASAGANGTISPSGIIVVNPPRRVSFTVTPAPGYVASVASDCGGSLTGTTYTTDLVDVNCTVVASFTQNVFTMTPIIGGSGSHGTIDPSVPTSISPAGGRGIFQITPDAGYATVVNGTCGGAFISPNEYLTEPIFSDCTVIATFVPTFTVTPSAGTNGSISPTTEQTIAQGDRASFTVTPNIGYAAAVVGTCGGTLAGTTYTTNPVTQNCTMVANFVPATYRVTPNVGANGSVTPATVQFVVAGSRGNFFVSPQPGYSASVGGTCGGSLINNGYTTAPIHTNCSVDFRFLPPQSPGTLDTSFNGKGYVDDLSVLGTVNTEGASSVAVQPDGKIVVAGTCESGIIGNTVTNLCMMRLNANGSLDATFDGPDTSGTGVGNGRGKFVLTIVSSLFGVGPPRVALQADGKIVVATTCRPEAQSFSSFCIARLNPNGSFDTAFDGPGANGAGVGQGQGRVVLPSIDDTPRNNILGVIAIDPAGRILLGGGCTTSDGLSRSCVMRLAGDGSFDRTFTRTATGRYLLPAMDGTRPNRNDTAKAIDLDEGGRIVVASKSDLLGSPQGVFETCFMRLNDNADTDTTFGLRGNGLNCYTPYQSFEVESMVRQPEGKIVFVGTERSLNMPTGAPRIFAASLKRNGLLDETQSTVPRASVTMPAASRKVLLQADGRWIVIGECKEDADAASAFCVARLNADVADVRYAGNVDYDKSFGDGGSAPPDLTNFTIGSNSVAADAALQPDGKIVVAGRCTAADGSSRDRFCIARIHAGALAGRECSLDIDGDGRVSALTDGLINTRIALGLTGNAVTNGVRFAAHAQRTNWPSIRDYLVSRCEIRLP